MRRGGRGGRGGRSARSSENANTRGTRGGRLATKSTDMQMPEDEKDEVDVFNDQRDIVALNPDNDDKFAEQDDDDEGDVLALAEDDEDAEEDNGSAPKPKGDISQAWGRSKGAYYNADTGNIDLDIETEEEKQLAVDEEKEAIRLQQQRATELNEEDLGADSTLASILAKKSSAASSKTSKKSTDKKATSEKKSTAQEAEDEQESKGEKEWKEEEDESDVKAKELMSSLSFDQNTDDVEIEKVNRDINRLSSDEKLQVVMQDSPELLPMLDELKAKMSEIKTFLQPILKKVQKKQLPTTQGMSFLELKFQLLLQYCIHTVFYLLLKAEGKSVKDHPVVKHLVQIRTVLEKIKPLDKKLKYQIDKLLKQSTGPANPAAADPLQFKPKPAELESKNEATEAGSDDTYVPPKLAAAEFEDEKSANKRKEKEAKQRQKALKSSALRDLAQDYLETPEEISYAVESDRPTEDDIEREKYEEDYFTRIPESKQDKKKRKRAGRINPLEDLEDFDDSLDALVREERDEKTKMEKARQAAADRALAASRKKVIVPEKDSDDEFGDEDLEFYEAAAEQQRAKKKQKREAYPEPEFKMSAQDPDQDIEEDARRAAGKNILQNRGLTPYRRKDIKTPRTRTREKFRKKEIKRRSTVQEYKGSQTHNYSGEATGIKTNLVRSQKLR